MLQIRRKGNICQTCPEEEHVKRLLTVLLKRNVISEGEKERMWQDYKAEVKK